MTERGASYIPIEDFRPDYHDPDEWLKRFEKAVNLATNCRDEDRQKELYLAWLPMKLDDGTRLLLSGATNQDDWAELKKEFKELLITPQDKYNWRSGRKRITWDGRENFHALAARVKRTIDRYEDRPKEADYYHEFRLALPRNYQQAIDLGHAGETLAEAKRIALRCQAALAGGNDDGAGATKEKSVAFIGGVMSENKPRDQDRLKEIEMGLQGMSVKVDNLASEVARNSKEARAREERARSPTPGPSSRQPLGAEGGSYDVGPSRRNSPNQRYDSRERYKPRYQDQDRFDDDDYVYSLGQGQRDGNRRSREEHRYPPPQEYRYPPPQEYRYPPPQGHQYPPPQDFNRGGSGGYGYNPYQGGQQGWGSSGGYSGGGQRGSSPRGGRGYSPNQNRGFRPNPNRGSSPNGSQSQRPNPTQGSGRGGRTDGRPPPTAPDVSQGGQFRGMDYDQQYQWFCQAVLEKEQRDARPLPNAPSADWGRYESENY